MTKGQKKKYKAALREARKQVNEQRVLAFYDRKAAKALAFGRLAFGRDLPVFRGDILH